MNLTYLLKSLPHYKIYSTSAEVSNIDISKITSDSRQVEAGSLFVAYRGVYRDGHQFIPQAIQQGAAAIIGEEGTTFSDDDLTSSMMIIVPDGREALAYLSAAWYQFPAHHLTMVGITGTDGKTTTTNILYHLLQAEGKKTSMINTVNAIIGDKILETGLHTTTPDSPDIQRFLSQMVEAETEICLLEVTSHGLAHHRVTACDFDIAIVTNITHEHLDLHGSLEAYRAAKASLFESLALAKDKKQPKAAILNCDDWSFEYLKAKLERDNIAWRGYSLDHHPEATVTTTDIRYQPDRTYFTLQGSKDTVAVETVLVGDYNISNCLAAATAALEILEISPQALRRGMSALLGIPGRMERIDEGQSFMAVVDFAHTPNALRRSLSVAQTITNGRVIAIFGCAGLRDVEKRVMMGQIAAELADITLITAEDPRTEPLDQIIAETAEAMLNLGLTEGEDFERVPDRGRAIYRAVQIAQSGDMVIALGKGHEQSMCFGETEYPWDDRQAMRTALRGSPLLTLPTA